MVFNKLNKIYQHLIFLSVLRQCCITHGSKEIIIRRQKLNMRCTRRFSPGVCAEPVSPVWNFDFFSQNCTERLGCTKSTRSNRFPSFANCFRSCRGFIDIYTQTLSENAELSKRLRTELESNGEHSGRRLDDRVHASFYEEQIDSEQAEAEPWGGPALNIKMDDANRLVQVGGVFAPDIDYSGVQTNNEDCDLVHHVRDANTIN